MDSRLRTIFKYVLPLALAAVLVYFSFRGVDWEHFWNGLKACEWGYVGVSMLVGLCSMWIRGLRWRELLKPLYPNTSKTVAFNAICISYVVNMVLPRVGELVRCGYITGASRRGADGKKEAKYEKVFGTAIVDRMWDLVILVILLLVAVLFAGSGYSSFFSSSFSSASKSFSYVTFLIVIGIVLLAAAFVWAAYRLRSRSVIMERVAHVCDGIWQGIGSCLKMKSWWKFIVYTVMIWVCYWGMSWFIVLAVKGIDPAVLSSDLSGGVSRIAGLDGIDAFYLMMAGAISSLIPVPGGFGAFHYVVSQALYLAYGIPTGIGIIFATLSHESQAVMQLFAGAVAWVRETLRRDPDSVPKKSHAEPSAEASADVSSAQASSGPSSGTSPDSVGTPSSGDDFKGN